ncbi:MAG: DUF554 domain-containing protein [Firmicutes bacterium]|nr:DUF554 domain-containing protein [Bacillota bacterium]
MIGTIVNACTILLGSVLGGTFKRFLSKKLEDALLGALGMAAFGIGIPNVVKNMPDSKYPVLFIVSLALGVLCGTLLDIDGRLKRAAAPKAKAGNVEAGAEATASGQPGDEASGDQLPGPSAGHGRLIEGLTTGCLIYCIGALSILGPIEAALRGDHTLLFTNATLDLVTSTVLAATYGYGMMIAAGVLFLWQGSIYVLTLSLGEFISAAMMTELSIVGGFMIAMTGIGIMGIKDFKVLNFLPALIVPVVWCLITGA